MYERIYAVIRAIPPGRVLTYGQVGAVVGCPARQVGYALHQLFRLPAADVPWQRVVNRNGGISTSGVEQQTLLEAEGVVFNERGELSLARYGWNAAGLP